MNDQGTKNKRIPLFAPATKRLVDLVDRGPEDETFFPIQSNQTIFRRTWPTYHNVVTETTELSYQGSLNWGNRITVSLSRQDSGDLIQWLCLRLKPRSWMGAEADTRIFSGKWSFQDPSSAWVWADSLGSIAIQKVEFEIGDAPIETWPGEWLDIWSRINMDLGRAPAWDADIYAKQPAWSISDPTRPAWTNILPTEDGYFYCWLPLAFMKRPQTAFPLAAMGPQQEIRIHITLRPFAEVVRRRAVPRASPSEVPLNSSVVILDQNGGTSIPYEYLIPNYIPGFDDSAVMAGIVQTEDPLRSAYMKIPIEMMYEPVSHMKFESLSTLYTGTQGTVTMNLELDAFNGPLRSLIFFARRKDLWPFNEWTNYGALLERDLLRSIPAATANVPRPIPVQQPIIKHAKLMVGNAIWKDEDEQWWRYEFGAEQRGGVRASRGMVYGIDFGFDTGCRFEDFQPTGTVNASRANLKLELDVTPPTQSVVDGSDSAEWEIHVFAVGINWLRFVSGQAVPLFKD